MSQLHSPLHLPSVLLLIAMTAGCSALSSTEQDDRGPDLEAPGDIDSNGNGTCIVEHGVDSDGDGLLDIYEDLNQNCLLDPGETDPFNPDTDGDGLLDGDEDADGNGVWDKDRGELNPLMVDTDANGIPDSQEPKAQVCNRYHAKRALAERRLLPNKRALYLHPDIKNAAPFGATDAIFILGHNAQSAGIIFESESDTSAFEEILGLLSEGLPDTAPKDSYLVLQDVYEHPDRGTLDAHIQLVNHRLELQEIIELLAEYAPALEEPMALADSYVTTERNWSIQLQGERLAEGKGTRWALSWKASGSPNDWFYILRPQIVGAGDKTNVRFVCENINAQSEENLSVFLVLDDHAIEYSEPWLNILDELVSERATRGADTEVYALQSYDEEWAWAEAHAALNQRDLAALSASFEASSFDHSIAQALQLPAWETIQSNALILVLSASGSEEERIDDAPLPPIPSELYAARMIVAAPTASPFQCARRMTDARRQAVQRLVHWGYARQTANCGIGHDEDDLFDPRTVTALAAERWAGTERTAIPGTLWLADGNTSVPARSHSIGGVKVTLANQAKTSDNTAVSFAAWFD